MKVKAADIVGSGCECTVYNLSSKRVYKQYNEYPEEIANIIDRAKEAFHAGIAPKVFDTVEDGYITEKVKLLDDSLCYGCDDCHLCDRVLEDNGFTMKDYKELLRKAENLGFDTFDLHIANIGIKDNKLVMIDFGMIST